jgi:hypothetical protein
VDLAESFRPLTCLKRRFETPHCSDFTPGSMRRLLRQGLQGQIFEDFGHFRAFLGNFRRKSAGFDKTAAFQKFGGCHARPKFF